MNGAGNMNQCLIGDCRTILPELIAERRKVQMCVTSPPYWGLRDYGVPKQLGLESTRDEYVANMVEVFRLVRELLADDGTLWLNLGDSYSGSGKGGNPDEGKQATNKGSQSIGVLYGKTGETAREAALTNVSRRWTSEQGIPPKNLIGIPWRVAFALQADGWWLRQDIIWSKPNPMPESVRDRCTKSHEYLFLLAKNQRYYYDADAIAEPLAYGSVKRLSQPTLGDQRGSDRVPGKTNGPMKAVYKKPYTNQSTKDYASGGAQDASATKARIVDSILSGDLVTRNKRSVWTVATQPYAEAHFATFPPALIEPCILAGSRTAGKRCDCDQIIESPLAHGSVDDPSLLTGRAGMNRPRRQGEGTRLITRREQRAHAEQMKASPHRDEMAKAAGEAFAHYIRTDASGARPLPHNLLSEWMSRGWLTPPPSCDHLIMPPDIVLDPFFGTGTVGEVAQNLGRRWIGIELNPAYKALQDERVREAEMVL